VTKTSNIITEKFEHPGLVVAAIQLRNMWHKKSRQQDYAACLLQIII
jgi:hypothetical protein